MPGRAPISIADAHAQLTAPGSPFEMEVVDIDGRPAKTWKNAMPSIRALVEASRAHGDASFIVYEDEGMTFAQHYHGLRDHGARRAPRASARALSSALSWTGIRTRVADLESAAESSWRAVVAMVPWSQVCTSAPSLAKPTSYHRVDGTLDGTP
jgi:hypothetical protein